MKKDIAISIINFRSPEMTIDCAASVLAQLGGMRGEIVIVDNRSDDGSVEKLEAWIAGLPEGAPVRLVRSATNSGFSGGHNQGMAAVEAEHYLILNSDAYLRPGFLDRILAKARQHPEAGFIAPRLEGEDGTVQDSCFRFVGPMSEFIRGANTGVITEALSAHNNSLGPDPDEALVDWASFACILLNGTMVRQIGPMDEGYFLYFEDMDYCLKARRAGWRVRRCPEAVAVHLRGGSGPVKTLVRERARLPAYFYSSRTRYMYKAHGLAGLWAANLLWLVGRGIARARHLTGRKGNNFIKGDAVDIWTNVFRPLGSRMAPGE